MAEDIKSSLSTVTKDRLKSPFYGSLIISWTIWNWKIIYVTIFINQKSLQESKLEYIEKYLSSPWINYVGPFISTIFLITLAPFLNNGAYWISLQFQNWRRKKRHEVESTKLLTLAQSIEISSESKRLERDFHNMIIEKDKSIDLLKNQLTELYNKVNSLRIIKAEYGKDTQWHNVTADLEKHIKDNALKIIVTHRVLGGHDPTPGIIKDLKVIYEYNNEIKEILAIEGNHLQIP